MYGTPENSLNYKNIQKFLQDNQILSWVFKNWVHFLLCKTHEMNYTVKSQLGFKGLQQNNVIMWKF